MGSIKALIVSIVSHWVFASGFVPITFPQFMVNQAIVR